MGETVRESAERQAVDLVVQSPPGMPRQGPLRVLPIGLEHREAGWMLRAIDLARDDVIEVPMRDVLVWGEGGNVPRG